MKKHKSKIDFSTPKPYGFYGRNDNGKALFIKKIILLNFYLKSSK